MAEGFGPYHVPQQSRRDKLRIVAQNNPHDLQSLLPLYDPSFLSSSSLDLHQNSASVVKDEASNSNLMAFSAAASSYNPYLDPHSSNLPNLNPNSSIHDISSNLLLCTQNLKAYDEAVIPFRPEPLSLSLSSQSNLPLELNLQRYGSAVTSSGGYSFSGDNGVSKSAVPLGPFTGYASVLKESRYLKHAQHLLEEFCDVGRPIYSEKFAMDASFFDSSTDCLNTNDDPVDNTGNGSEIRRNKSRLISMLDEVYKRYKHYYQQIKTVVSSFECVAGLGNAAPFAHLAFISLSRHFKSLKNTITDQLQLTNKGKEEPSKLGNYNKTLYFQSPGFTDHQPVWRPQRGLPERAVNVLKAWLFEHFLHPYPTDGDKIMLAKQTGLSRSQVSNWFINARVRLWKPMVEEIHMLETRQAQKGSANSAATENPSTSAQRVHDIPLKRTRNDLPHLPFGNEDPLNLSFNGMANNQLVGVSLREAGRSNGVSLTLGLHQNNGMGASEPFPMNAVQSFGVGIETSDGLVMGGLEAQNPHFRRDVIEGQLLHDFVS